MTINTNFNTNPYYDDFDEDKKHLRMLFKPGYAVQARELTQLQTLLQNQTSRFGKHVFTNGSKVSGAGQTAQAATYLKLNSSYSGVSISANSFNGMTIYSTDNSKRGQVIKVYDADAGTGDPITLMVKQLYGSDFVPGETIKTSETSPAYANVSTSGVGTGITFSVDGGYWFYEGFFIKSSAQTIAVSKYGTKPNVIVGFEITESVVTSSDDTTLLDPALDASNYQAPGADRYVINMTLSSRPLTSTDTTAFIQIGKFVNGAYQPKPLEISYSVLADEFAHRTFDQSGSYTVNPFKITLADSSSNSAQTVVTLSPAKAYIFGYEIETKFPTDIVVDKPRDTLSVSNKDITADYGEYVYTTNHYGTFPIDSLSTIDVHCVSKANVNTSSVAALSNTKIGTVRVKSYQYDSATNTSNSQTYAYRTSLFDINIVNSITGNVNTATSTTVTIGNVSTGQIFSSVTDAYTGAKFRITTGTGSDEAAKTITSFNAATQTLTFSAADAFVNTPTSASKFSIDFEFASAESFIVNSSTTIVSSADISSFSKDPAATYNDAYISDTGIEPLIFKFGEDWIANNSVTNMLYYYKKLYTGVTFSGNTATISVPDAARETFVSAATSSAELTNYDIVCTSASGKHIVGQTVTSANLSVSLGGGSTTASLTVTDSNSMTANVIATIYVPIPVAKSKTYVTCNPCVQTSSSNSGSITATVDSGNVIVFGTQGQTTIAANTVNKVPGTAQSLYVTDVTQLVQVLDFNGAAVANTGGTDVTSKYTLDSGQRDSYYDHASIILKSGVTAPKGPLAVRYNRYTSSGSGFFTNASYIPNYTSIPSYTARSGVTYSLRDCIDYRPLRADASGSYTTGTVSFDLTSLTGPKIPEMGSPIIASYSYYLPRIDRVVIHKTGVFDVVKGISAINPVDSPNPSDAMTLYMLHNPPYVANTSNINVQYVENKRYTMRDIGTLEQRIQNLEYYTSLSLIEQDTLNKQDLTILDSTNLPRFKNGIITDSFKGHSVADVTKDDYKASIDIQNQEMRPTFNISSYSLAFDSANSTNYLQYGPFVTVSANSVTFVDQPLASSVVNVNPFNVTKFLGHITLNPPSDIWVDSTRAADVLVDLSGSKDAWTMITKLLPVTYQWGSWQDIFFGASTTSTSGAYAAGGSIWQTSTTTQSVTQQRQGIMTSVVPEQITQSLGDKVIDVSVIPYMRANRIAFYATNLKPITTLYPFFDNKPVETYVARANRFLIDKGGLLFHCGLGTPEKINVANTLTGTTINVVKTAQNSGNSVFTFNIVDVPGASFVGNTKIVGQQSGLTANVVGYEHYSGNAVSATSSTIVISKDASGANNEGYYANTANSNIIFIVGGTGAGQQATISSYNAGTRTITISGTWTTTPDTSSIYSIGRMTTTRNGDISGLFYMQGGIYKIGEKTFALVDNSINDLPSCGTSGEVSYFAQGLLQTMQKESITTIQPTIQRIAVTSSQVITRTIGSRTQWLGWDTPDPGVAGGGGGCDPLAETFTVSQVTYPNGIVLDKVRVCFATKDTEMPVILQVRPSVNGYPSADTVFPFASVTLTPDKVNAIGTDGTPSLDDASKYTEFVLDSPLYLKAGEHSIVLMTPSNQYSVFVADVGLNNFADGTQISKQPYTGSLFKSQNASTWTPEQNSDLMFRIYRKSFDTNNSAYAYFNLDLAPTANASTLTANTPFDVAFLSTSEIVVANTSLSYAFNSETSTGGYSGYKNIKPLTNYSCHDGSERRILNPTTGAKTFIVRATLGTTDEAVSPMLDTYRFGVLAIENIINNMPLLNTGFSITTIGSGYTANTGVTISAPASGGVQANAYAYVSGGNVVSIIVDTPGSGYTTSPTVTIAAPPVPSGNTTAVATYNGEDSKVGGNSVSRYIARKVTLADGFDSGDLRVYVTAYKPSGSNILVYYKMLSKSDSDIFDNKSYQLMTELGNKNFVSTGPTDYRELTFAPGVSGSANNSVSYTSGGSLFTSFKTFAIKIVLTGTSTTDVPKVRDFRAIALPAGTV